MLQRLFGRKYRDTASLYNGPYMEVRALYTMEFDRVPCMTYIGSVSAADVFRHIKTSMRDAIRTTYQHNYYEHSESELLFNFTVIVLEEDRMIEIGPGYCQLLHGPEHYGWARSLAAALAEFRIVEEQPAIGFARSHAMN
jgi:hypothetical protein